MSAHSESVRTASPETALPLAKASSESIEKWMRDQLYSPEIAAYEESLKRDSRYGWLLLRQQFSELQSCVTGGATTPYSPSTLRPGMVPPSAALNLGGQEPHPPVTLLPGRATSMRGSVLTGASLPGRRSRNSPKPAIKPNVVIRDCEELMLLLFKRDAEVARLSARDIEKRMVKEFGKDAAFSYRTIQETALYKAWRRAAKKLRFGHDIESDSDAMEHGLHVSRHKPGRSNRRREYARKPEELIRSFNAEMENATIAADRRVEERKQSRSQ